MSLLNVIPATLTPDMFSQFFTSTVCATQPSTVVAPFLPDPIFDSSRFYFKPITSACLTSYLSASFSDARGADQIPFRYWRLAMPVIFPFLLDVLNFSLTYSVFPVSWKQAIVQPISKVKHPKTLADYRPISILCSLSKVLERIVHRQLTDYLESNNIFDDMQSGFRMGFSTQTALLKLTDDIRLAVDSRMVTVLILFDFSKAFDMVRHDFLLAKLRTVGCSAAVLNWVLSYLSDRQQAARGPDGSVTSFRNTTSGVPQGSVLGPLLFSLSINDLPLSIRNCSHIFYADDLQIYLSSKPDSLSDSIKRINEDVRAISG